MHIERFDPVTGTDEVRACYEIYVAGQQADNPGGPTMSRTAYCGRYGLSWTGAPLEAWLIRGDEAGTLAAAATLELPAAGNRHLGILRISVAPGRRRAGLGTALLRHAAARMRELGRTVLSGVATRDSPGAAFAAAMGGRACLLDVRRVLDLADLPAGKREALRRQAETAARGYSLVSWTGPCPEEYLDQVAEVLNALEDAPRGPGTSLERMDARRVRQAERLPAARGLRTYLVAVRPGETGELAGLSQVGVDPEQPGWAHQEITAVTRPHRGHRLGLLLKLAMLDLLAEAEPGVSRITTGNADGNHHMVAINVELGFRVFGYWSTWHLDVAQVLDHS